jgi:prepilin-type N-terminal cleavage/methylation domain-containing protein
MKKFRFNSVSVARSDSRRGFTLIELLVVIAIIAILTNEVAGVIAYVGTWVIVACSLNSATIDNIKSQTFTIAIDDISDGIAVLIIADFTNKVAGSIT